MKRERTRRLLFGLGVLLIAHGRATAQAQTPPIVSVIKFAGEGTHLSEKDGEAVAGALAERLVASGQYRVMEQMWLPIPKDMKNVPLATLRDAAANVGVDYLVVGSLQKSVRVVAGPARAPVGIRPSPFGMRPFGPGPFRARPVAVRQSFIALIARVIDVHSGEVVSSTMAEIDPSAPKLAALAAGPRLLPAGPVGAVADLVVAALKLKAAKASGLDGGLQHAIADAANALASSAPRLVAAGRADPPAIR